MKTSTRNLIIVAAGIVVLGGATAALMLTGGGQGASSSPVSTSTIDLVSKKSEDIVSMSVKNKKGSYTLIPVTKTVPATSSASSGSASSAETETTYTVKELENVPIDSAAAGQVIQNGFSLTASKNLGTVDNLDEYGLKDPQATVEVSFKDGSSYNYKIGSESATDSSAYYMSGEDSNNVYVVSVDSGILEDQNYFISKAILTVAAANGEQNDFTKVTLSGRNFPQPITVGKVGDADKIMSPFSADTDANNVSAIETALTTVTASSVEAVNPDAAALKNYGLDQPAAIAEFTANKVNYKLLAGAKKDNSYYVMLDKGNVVYLVSADSITPWAEATAFSLRSKLIFTPMITDVKSISVTQGTAATQVTVARTKDETKSTEDTPAFTYKVTGTDAKALDYETNYKNFYKNLISIELLEGSDAKPSGTPAYSVEYQYFDKNTKDILQFYNGGDRRYLVVLNGEVCGTVTSTDVDKIFTSYQQLQSGQSVQTDA